MVLVVRSDLPMGKGKAAAQAFQKCFLYIHTNTYNNYRIITFKYNFHIQYMFILLFQHELSNNFISVPTRRSRATSRLSQSQIEVMSSSDGRPTGRRSWCSRRMTRPRCMVFPCVHLPFTNSLSLIFSLFLSTLATNILSHLLATLDLPRAGFSSSPRRARWASSITWCTTQAERRSRQAP